MSKDYEFFINKRTDRIYLSKSLEDEIPTINEENELITTIKEFRIISKMIETEETHTFFKNGKQIDLRITAGAKQEIKAKFYEDSRDIFTLQIQKYTVKDGKPHSSSFTFVGEEIITLFNFIRNIAILPLTSKESIKLDDKFVEEIVLTRDQAMTLIQKQPELIKEIIDSELNADDVANLGFRKKQLIKFNKLLTNEDYFDKEKTNLGVNKRNEDVWQNFFEENTWIFGYGLNYYLNTPIEGEKLEQVTKGYDFNSTGKRVDALLKTQSIISSLSFGEIKTHRTPLLHTTKEAYRNECWRISNDLSGSIAQVQKTIQISLSNIKSKTEIKNKQGDLTGEQLFLYHPKSFLIIGSLSEFNGTHGINEDKYSSFELFRRQITNTEIITFDELYERAKYIVEFSS